MESGLTAAILIIYSLLVASAGWKVIGRGPRPPQGG